MTSTAPRRCSTILRALEMFRCRVICFALAALSAGHALAGDSTGYDSDYDYPLQGDAWYGRMSVPRSDRDYAPPFADLVLSGEDFCNGYEQLFDPLRLGPPLVRTETMNGHYEFRFGYAATGITCLSCGDGNPCTVDAWDPASEACLHDPQPNGSSCDNGSFCDGSETCQDAICGAGLPPACDDGVACTIDVCDEALDMCTSLAPPPPAEVEELALAPTVPGSRVILLTWGPSSNADAYHLYSSGWPDLRDLSCYDSPLAEPSARDRGEVPAIGMVFAFLVTASDCVSESTLGFGAQGERMSGNSCL